MVLNPNFCHGQFFSHSLPLLPVTWAGSLGHLILKTEEKGLSSSAFSRSWLSPVFFQRGPTFSLVFLLSPTYLWSLSLLLFPSLATHQGFSFPNLIPGCSDNFSVFFPGYLFFPSSSVGFLFVSWVCPGDPFSPTWASKSFCLTSSFFGIHCSWAWGRWSLNINQISWPLFPPGLYLMALYHTYLWRGSPELQGVTVF